MFWRWCNNRNRLSPSQIYVLAQRSWSMMSKWNMNLWDSAVNGQCHDLLLSWYNCMLLLEQNQWWRRRWRGCVDRRRKYPPSSRKSAAAAAGSQRQSAADFSHPDARQTNVTLLVHATWNSRTNPEMARPTPPLSPLTTSSLSLHFSLNSQPNLLNGCKEWIIWWLFS